MPTATDAAALQLILADLSTEAIADLVALWRKYSDDPDFAALLLAAFPEIIDPYTQSGALVSAQWYTELAPDLAYTAEPFVDLPDDRLTGSVNWALYAPGKATPLERLSGSVKRMVYDASRQTVLHNLGAEYGDPPAGSFDDEPGTRWARYASANACSFCKMLATRAAVYRSRESAERVTGRSVDITNADRRHIAAGQTTRDEALARRATYSNARAARKAGKSVGDRKTRRLRGTSGHGNKYHDNCVPAGTLVAGPRAESAYRRLYEGEAVVIHTASGQKLTITPNHPVLTDQGWVPAGLLDDRSYVARATSSQPRPTTVPDEYERPSLIEDVWSSRAVDGLSRVPGSPENFHGDGTNSQVDVVGTNSRLHGRFDTELSEPTNQLLLTGSLRGGFRTTLTVGGKLAPLLPSAFAATDCGVRRSGELLALFSGKATHADVLSRRHRSRFDTKFDQSSADDDPSCPHASRDFDLREALVYVESADFVDVEGSPVARRFDPAGAEFSVENRSRYSDLGLDLLNRLGGQVELDRVVQLDRIRFSGHVYNLETIEGWYSASSLIVSNCRCIAVPVRPGTSYQPPDYVDQWEDDYVAATRAVSASGADTGGKSELKAILREMDARESNRQNGVASPPIEMDNIELTGRDGQPVTRKVPADSPAARAYVKRRSQQDAAPPVKGGSSAGPPKPPKPPVGPPPAAAGDGQPGWSGHGKNYQHPHGSPKWTEAERVRRQADLGVVPAGEQLHQHEIEGVERLIALGEQVQWLPRTDERPTNDMRWISNGDIEVDLKSTKAKYATISNHFRDSVEQAAAARARGIEVRKDRFIVDLGPKSLSPKLRSQLSRYNQRNPHAPIAALWVLAKGELIEVPQNQR